MVATDSYRLTVKETTLEAPLAEGFEANVPARALEELGRLTAADAETISVGVRANQVVFGVGDVALSSRLIDGQFPNYRQLLPEQFEHELTLDTAEFLEVVERISLMAQKNAPLRLSFTRGRAADLGADAGRRRGERQLRRAVRGRTIRDRVQPGVPDRRPAERRRRAGRPEADQPAAPGAARVRRRERLPLPHHAHPPERLMRTVRRLRVRDVRTYDSAEVTLGPRLTIVHGPNGAGKTNLLEALYVGLTGRSCRTGNDREVIRFDAPALRVEVDIETGGRDPRARRRLRAVPAAAHHRRRRTRGAPARRRLPPARQRVPAGPPRAREGRARAAAARTSTRSSRRCGRRASHRAAATPRRSRSATRCSRACGRAATSSASLRTWDLELGRLALALRDDRARAAELIAPGRGGDRAGARASTGEAELRYRPRTRAATAEEFAAELARAPRLRPRPRLHRARSAPRRPRALARRPRAARVRLAGRAAARAAGAPARRARRRSPTSARTRRCCCSTT